MRAACFAVLVSLVVGCTALEPEASPVDEVEVAAETESAIEIAASRNLLKNSGFENPDLIVRGIPFQACVPWSDFEGFKPGAWCFDNKVRIVEDAAGNARAALDGGSRRSSTIAQTVTGDPRKTYVLSFEVGMFNVEPPASEHRARIDFFGGDENILATRSIRFDGKPTRRVAMRADSPPGTRLVRVTLIAPASDRLNEWVYDAVRLRVLD